MTVSSWFSYGLPAETLGIIAMMLTFLVYVSCHLLGLKLVRGESLEENRSGS